MEERVIENKEYIDLLLEEPYKIGHFVGLDKFTELHNEWIKKFVTATEDMTLQAHRGSYKTTCLIIAIAILVILQPNKNIIFLRKTDDDIKEVITAVQNILLSPEVKFIISKVYPGFEFEIIRSNTSEILTNLKTDAKGSPQLLGIGIKGSITGKHADIVITDDIINIKDRVSRAEREHTKQIYQELQNVKNRGGRIINTGTPWHKEDCFTLMGNIEKYDCYTTGLISNEELQKLRKTMSPSLFSANYELQHIADEDALFTNAEYTNKAELVHEGICHIDARYSGTDHTAFTIVKKHEDKFYIYGKVWDKHVDDCIHEILALREKYRAGTIYCEDNADKGYLAKELKKHGAITKTYHESMNKYVKIITHLKGNWDKIVFIDNTDTEYINEILDYTENAEHDDCPDSLASALRILGENRTIRVESKPVGL